MYTCKSEPHVNYGLWVLLMNQVDSSNLIFMPLVLQDGDNGEAVLMWGQKSLYLLLNFVVNQKLL